MSRHYRTTLSRLIMYPFGGLALCLGLIVTLVPRGAIVLHVVAAICVIVLFLLIRRIKLIGVKTSDDCLIVYNVYATRQLRWVDIDRFDTRRWGINHEVGIWLKSGNRIRTSLVQGRVVRWQRGKTRDIMSVLQEEMGCAANAARITSLNRQ